jgi:hypothetical protein
VTVPGRRKKKTASARFAVGDRVRVRHGVTDYDNPDLPLGGWAAEIQEIHDEGSYIVRWTEETLATVHPIYRKRCERDGTVFEIYGLGEEDLVPDAGGPLEIEPPARIATKPLSKKNQDDRVRMVLGLTSNDPLPEVTTPLLAAYRTFLAAHLSFPFEARHEPERGGPAVVKVTGLGEIEDDAMVDEHYGLLCTARFGRRGIVAPLDALERVEGRTNRQLVDDYSYWFQNWR